MSQNKDEGFNSGLEDSDDLIKVVYEPHPSPSTRTGPTATPALSAIYSQHITRAESSREESSRFKSAGSGIAGTPSELQRISPPSHTTGVLQTESLVTDRSSDSGSLTLQTAQGAPGNKAQVADCTSNLELRNLLLNPTVAETIRCRPQVTGASEEVRLLSSHPLSEMSQNESRATRSAANISQHKESSTSESSKNREVILELVSRHSQKSDHSPKSAVEEIERFPFEPMKIGKVDGTVSQTGPSVIQALTPTTSSDVRYQRDVLASRNFSMTASPAGPSVSQSATPTTSGVIPYQPDAVASSNFARTASQNAPCVSQTVTPTNSREIRYQPDAVTSGNVARTASETGPSASKPVIPITLVVIRYQPDAVVSGNVARTSSQTNLSVSQPVTPTTSGVIRYEPDAVVSGNVARTSSQNGPSVSQSTTPTTSRVFHYQPDAVASRNYARTASQNGLCFSQPITPTTSREIRYKPDGVTSANVARTVSETGSSASQPVTPITSGVIRYHPDAVVSGNVARTASQTGQSASQPVTPTTSREIRYQPDAVTSGNVARTASQTGPSVSQPVTPIASGVIRYQPDAVAKESIARTRTKSMVVHEPDDPHPGPPTGKGLTTKIYSDHITRAESSRVKPPQFESAGSTSSGTQSHQNRLHSAPSNTPGVLQTGSLLRGRSSDCGTIPMQTAIDYVITEIYRESTTRGDVGNKSQVANSTGDSEITNQLPSITIAEIVGCRSQVTGIPTETEAVRRSSTPLAKLSRNESRATLSAANLSRQDESSTSESSENDEDDILEFVSQHSHSSDYSPLSADSSVEEIVRYLIEPMETGIVAGTASQTGPCVSQLSTPTTSSYNSHRPDVVGIGNFARTASRTGSSARQPVKPTTSRDIRYKLYDMASRNIERTASQTGPYASQPETPTISKDIRYQPDAVISGNVAGTHTKSNPAATSPSKKSSESSRDLCQMCGKLFANMYNLHIHTLEEHSSEPQFPCPMCSESFDNRADLADHEVTHKDLDSPFRCRSCYSAFPNLQSLQDHQLEHNPELVHQCGRCPRAFDSMEKLSNHYQVHGRGLSDINKCTFCSQVFPNRHRLVDHVKSLHTKMYMCLVCPMNTIDSLEFVAHYRAHGVATSAPCPVCYKAFLNRAMTKHLGDHPEFESYFCFICDPPRKLPSRKIYQRHLKNQKHYARYNCAHCKASFGLRSQYRNHLEVHSQFLCKYCESCFNNKFEIRRHVNIEHSYCVRRVGTDV